MLILPLDHSEPYFATLGVMLYPAVDDTDPPKARTYVAQVLARAFRRFRDAGGNPPYDVLAPVLMDAGEPLGDLQERWWGGSATGELFKTFFALYNTNHHGKLGSQRLPHNTLGSERSISNGRASLGRAGQLFPPGGGLPA